VVSWKVAAPGLEGLGFGVPAATLLKRLDIQVAAASSADPAALGGTRGGRGPVELVVDTPDAPSFSTPVPAGAPAAPPPPWDKKALGAAAGISVPSLLLVVGTDLAAISNKNLRLEGWRALQVANTIGWVGLLSGAGVGVYASPYVSGEGGPVGARVGGWF
jgi:hypothetical protein